MKKEIKFSVMRVTDQECIHDTGVSHTLGVSCNQAELMCQAFAMKSSDPDHEMIWHDVKNNPDLVKIEV